MSEIINNLHDAPTYESYIDDEFLQAIDRLAACRKQQAVHHRHIDRRDLPPECLELAADGFDASGDVYINIKEHLDNAPLDRLGSI